MKRALVVMVALVAMVAFVSGVMAQAPAQTEKPAVPAPEKAKEYKPKTMKVSGVVAGYEAGKMIKVKGPKGKAMAFDVKDDTKMKGEVKEGVKVIVTYTKNGDKMVATSIAVAPPPKKKAAPKEEKKI
jgi:Cu/Ag efflux protein CusF